MLLACGLGHGARCVRICTATYQKIPLLAHFLNRRTAPTLTTPPIRFGTTVRFPESVQRLFPLDVPSARLVWPDGTASSPRCFSVVYSALPGQRPTSGPVKSLVGGSSVPMGIRGHAACSLWAPSLRAAAWVSAAGEQLRDRRSMIPAYGYGPVQRARSRRVAARGRGQRESSAAGALPAGRSVVAGWPPSCLSHPAAVGRTQRRAVAPPHRRFVT
jgi:hypothetical protein